MSAKVHASVSREAFRFFHEHAGWSVPPGKAVCALHLARAERTLHEAQSLGVATISWEDDDLPYEQGIVSDEEQERLFDTGKWVGPFYCLLTVEGEHVASLSGIVVGPEGLSDPYIRVVEAELADEALDELRQAIGDARDERGL